VKNNYIIPHHVHKRCNYTFFLTPIILPFKMERKTSQSRVKVGDLHYRSTLEFTDFSQEIKQISENIEVLHVMDKKVERRCNSIPQCDSISPGMLSLSLSEAISQSQKTLGAPRFCGHLRLLL